jgi:threonine 3-dehydrogenase
VGDEIKTFEVGDRVSGVGRRHCGEYFYRKKGIFNLCINSHFMGVDLEGCMAKYLIIPAHATYKPF